jgi:hypothetical protein
LFVFIRNDHASPRPSAFCQLQQVVFCAQASKDDGHNSGGKINGI